FQNTFINFLPRLRPSGCDLIHHLDGTRLRIGCAVGFCKDGGLISCSTVIVTISLQKLVQRDRPVLWKSLICGFVHILRMWLVSIFRFELSDIFLLPSSNMLFFFSSALRTAGLEV